MATDDELELQGSDSGEFDNDIDENRGEVPQGQEREEALEEDDSEEDDSQQDSGDEGSGSSSAVGGPVAGVIVAATILVLAAVSNLVVSFKTLNVIGKNIEYSVSVEMDYDSSVDPNVDWNDADTGLVMVIANSKESYTKPLLTSDEGTEISVTPKSGSDDNTVYEVSLLFNGTIEGLTENRPYTVSVIGDEDGKTKVYCKKDIVTTGPVTELRGTQGYCNCTVDGNYYFKLKYTDDNSYYRRFSYRLLDDDGNEVASAEISDPKKEQVIPDVNQLRGMYFTLEITIISEKPADMEADHFSADLGNDAVLTVNQGTIVLTQTIEI